MSEGSFKIDVGRLRKQEKEKSPDALKKVDEAGDRAGFPSREAQSANDAVTVQAKRGRGRPKSPRTGQVHAKVTPPIHREIADEAKRRGVQQGVIIEEAWQAYLAANRPS